ncbi:MAG: TIGR01459 family HAD-type hydrolase, partial [Pseudomonadota bacterium]
LTNAPRPSTVIPGQLDRLGLSRDAYDAVVTSGDATRAAIARYLPEPAFRLGPEKDDPLFDGMAIDFAPLDRARFVICTGMVDDHSEQPEDYRGLLSEARRFDLPMICANPDIVVNWGGRLIYCAGALAQIYEQLGGEAIYGGKPHRPIYELAMATLAEHGGGPMDRRRVLAVGDGLATDIAGANAFGVDALFVASGNGVHQGGADAVDRVLKDAGANAVAAMEALTW